MRVIHAFLISAAALSVATIPAFARVPRGNVYALCETLVKQQLTNPRSARFPGTFSRELPQEVSNGWQWSAWVDAENPFGGTVRNHFTCDVTGRNMNTARVYVSFQ